MRSGSNALFVAMVWMVAVFILAIGWVLNVIALAHMAGPMTGLFALRVVGIFVVPLGSILGWFV